MKRDTDEKAGLSPHGGKEPPSLPPPPPGNEGNTIDRGRNAPVLPAPPLLACQDKASF